MPFNIETQGLALGGTVSGNLVITGTLNVQGAVTFDVAQTVTGDADFQGKVIIDITDTEAFQIRQNADANDVFTVDTTNRRLILGTTFWIGASFSNGVLFGNAANANSGAFIAGQGLFMGDVNGIKWSDIGNSVGATVQASIYRDLGDVTTSTLELRQAALEHNLRIHNTWTSTTDHEYGELAWKPQTNIFTIGTVKGSGGGTARAMSLRTDSVEAINISTSQLVTFGAPQTSAADAIRLKGTDLTSDATQDSPGFVLTSFAFAESSLTTRDWKIFGDGSAQGKLVWANQTNGGGYTDRMSLLNGTLTVETQLIVDSTNTEAFQVRVDSDAGDVFTINTSTPGAILLGTLAVTGATTLNGIQIIDETSTEAFLVRKDSDGGDIFTVDTTNSIVKVTGDLTVSNDILSAAGSHWTLGNTTAQAYAQLAVTGAYTSSGLVSSSTKLVIDGILTGLTGDTTRQAGAWVAAALTFQNSETVALAAQLILDEPTITIGSSTVVNASTLLITGAPTEGTALNTALLVQGGIANFQGTTTLGTPPNIAQLAYPTPTEVLTVLDGDVTIHDKNNVASESLQDGAFGSFTKWTDTGDFNEGTTSYDYLHSSGSGTLTQALADLTIAGKNNRWYEFSYTISNANNPNVSLAITSAFAAGGHTIKAGFDGSYVTTFKSAAAASSADFVLTATGTGTGTTYNIDTMSLKEIAGGDIQVAGKITGGGSLGIEIDGDGSVIIESDLQEALLVREAGDVLDIFTAGSTASGPTMKLGLNSICFTNGSSRWIFSTATNNDMAISPASPAILMKDTFYIRWSDNANALGASIPMQLQRDQVDKTIGTLELRSHLTTPHNFRVFTNWVSTTNNEYGEFGWETASGVVDTLTIGTVKGSAGGSARPMLFRTDSIEAINISTAQKVRLGIQGSDGDDEATPEVLTVIGGNLEVFDEGTLGAETLTDGDMSSSTNWAGVTDWSDTIGGTTTYAHSGGTGTLTQTAAQRVTNNEGSNARWYKFTYTVSSVTNVGANVLTITNAFAASTVTLDISSNATRSVIFQAHATAADTADFVLSATSDTASDTFTLDDLILKEVIGGNIVLGGKLTGGGSNGLQVSGGGTISTFEKNLGDVGATETIDWRDGNHQRVGLDENLTLTFIDPDGPASLVVHFVQDGSGTNTVAWPSNVDWEGGTAPTITTASASIDIITLYFDGTRYYGGFLQDFS